MNTCELIEKLYETNCLETDELLFVLNNMDHESFQQLINRSHETSLKYYGDSVFVRGLIEFTNYCTRDCIYCGIRCSNKKVNRYRLSDEQILNACREGNLLGYKTFVLQGGEDPLLTDERIIYLIKAIKQEMPECAITLSIGEKSYKSYESYFNAGADRYLLRHETASERLYKQIHPKMSFEKRMQCLWSLKEIGFQVGAGFMVGLPGQNHEDYLKDILFLNELKPHMVGIGPFIPHSDTPFAHSKGGDVKTTMMMIALVRLFLPGALIPATTALGSIDSKGREKGLLAGANVVMPNLTPVEQRENYLLYDGKICIGDAANKCRYCIEGRIINSGFTLDLSVGHHISFSGKCVW